MKLRMLVSLAGTPSLAPGDVVDRPAAVAKVWIAEQLAAPVREAGREAAVAPPAPEAAAARPRKARSRKRAGA